MEKKEAKDIMEYLRNFFNKKINKTLEKKVMVKEYLKKPPKSENENINQIQPKSSRRATR